MKKPYFCNVRSQLLVGVAADGACGPTAVGWQLDVNNWCAAIAVCRARGLGSQYLVRSRHRLTQVRGSINGRYGGGCSHRGWQAADCSANSRSNVSCSKGWTHTVDPLRSCKDSERSGHWVEVDAGFRGLLIPE